MRRVFSSLAAAIVVLIGTWSFLQPAQAAPGGITLDTSADTVYVGETITLDWTTEGLSLLVATGDWTLPNDAPAVGSLDITPTEAREYTFTLGGDDTDGRPVPTVTVTVNVIEEELPPIQEFVSYVASCGAVTFTNLTDWPVEVSYGTFSEPAPDGDTTIEPGGTARVTTDRGTLDFVATASDFGSQEGSVDLPSECATDDDDDERTGNAGSWNNGPRVAPAAGVTDGQGTLNWGAGAVAVVLALGALALGRRFATA